MLGIRIPDSEVLTSAKDLKQCTSQIQELVLSHLNQMIAGKLAGSIDILRESCTGEHRMQYTYHSII